MAQASSTIRCVRSIGLREAVVDPAHQITRALILQEEVKRVSGSVQRALPQVVARQGTAGLVVGFGAGPTPFRVSAPAQPRVALELGAGWALLECGFDVGPG